jgi:hypothetical protein
VLVAAVVVGEVTADVVNSGPPAADVAARSYAAAVVPIIEESTALRLWLTDVRQHAVRLGRLGVETALGRLVAGAHNLEYQATNLGIPPPSPRCARLLAEVLGTRATAARLVMGGVALAIGPSRDVTGATATLLRAGDDLAGSDGDYSRFVSSLPRRARRSVPLPSSTWAAPSQWSPAALGAFATMLSSSPGLLIHQSLVIVAVSLQPAALRIVGLPAPPRATSTTSTTTTSTTLPGLVTGSSLPGATTSTTSTSSTTTTTTLQVPPAGSVSCLQPTTRVSVDVVIANAGDVGESNLEVSASLAEQAPPAAGGRKPKTRNSAANASPPSCGPGGGTAAASASAGAASGGGRPPVSGVPRTVRRDIASLPAGTSDYVALPSMAVHGGHTYLLTVRLGSEHESVMLHVASG